MDTANDTALDRVEKPARSLKEIAAAIAIVVVALGAIAVQLRLPFRMDSAEAAISTLETQYEKIHKLQLYQVCTTEPAPTPREEIALEIDCSDVHVAPAGSPRAGWSPAP